MGKKKEKKPVVMVTCPWGCGPVPRDTYGEHLTKVHYKKKGKKIVGPFPKMEDEREHG